ncbi:MAG: hypothetical protein DRP79_09650 [Planctomycetota bacterium]|nr:MAG: hypothetical protein DRP79_09650 [Planctomycetota bacterium]
MIRKPNKLRLKLNRGELVVGSALHSWSPNVMEVAGFAGLDFMRIDGEHSWRQDSTAENLMRAAVIADVVPMLRVDRDNPYLIRKALEIGAGAVLVPNINTPKEAEAVVSAAKFPPHGIRGYCGDCFSAYWGTRAGKEWVDWSDTQPMIGIMIEHVKAMECLDEIMAVQGLDFIFFGAADYSMSIGLRKPLRYDERVLEALAKTISAAKRTGIHVGVPTEEENIERYYKMGVTIFEVSSDLLALDEVWRRNREFVEKLSAGKKPQD